MTSVAAPICVGCKHRLGTLLDPKCTAFPDAIPTPILLSETDHRQAYPGDHGIQFDPKNKDAAEYAEMMFAPVSTGA